MTYALGRKAWFICDRCGCRDRYLRAKTEWTGLRVCRDCYETKHPQLDLKSPGADAEALYQPRADRREPLEVSVGTTFPASDNSTLIGRGYVGQVEVSV